MSNNEIKDGRYYHGILTYINRPLGKYKILLKISCFDDVL